MDIKRTITITKIMQIYNDKTIYKIEQQTIVIAFLASIESVCIFIVVRCWSHESIHSSSSQFNKKNTQNVWHYNTLIYS